MLIAAVTQGSGDLIRPTKKRSGTAPIPNDKSHLHHCSHRNPTSPSTVLYAVVGEIIEILLVDFSLRAKLQYDSYTNPPTHPRQIHHRASCSRTPPSWSFPRPSSPSSPASCWASTAYRATSLPPSSPSSRAPTTRTPSTATRPTSTRTKPTWTTRPTGPMAERQTRSKGCGTSEMTRARQAARRQSLCRRSRILGRSAS